MSLGLSHSLSRYKLKFSPDKVQAPAEPWASSSQLGAWVCSTATLALARR